MLLPTDLTWMRETQEAAMLDRCQIGTRSDGAANEYNIKASSFAWGLEIRCGLSFPASRRESRFNAQAPLAEAMLRLPANTTIKSSDRVRITRRFGIALTTPETWEVEGEPGQGPSGCQVRLRKVTQDEQQG